MISYEEENATKLSATKKDFYQLWTELLNTAKKISDRWDPANTNESDPGVVLLKVLTAIADKLNYNIDANALEAFMPSAAQLESMQKLTSMLGYNMQYYKSATTDVQISYTKDASKTPISGEICIDKFTNLKDIDDSVNYVTLQAVFLNKDTTSKVVPCMEGELVECETDDDNIISMLQLDDNHRYYLPETQVAENGIFITSLDDNIESDEWERVDNLNIQRVKKHYYAFGFDSRVNLPYIQFPDDISSLIEDGLKIKYIRTRGANGNISKGTLYKMETPASWLEKESDTESDDSGADYYNTENYTVNNPASTQNGCDAESLNDAYTNFKKTIGTFDTLVTCRDYMNKIYQLTEDATSNNHLVSNIIVSDIRDDINRAITLCTFGDYGIEYKTIAKTQNFSGTWVDKATWDSEDDPTVKAGWAGIIISVYDWNNLIKSADSTYFNVLFKVVDNPAAANPEVKGYYKGIFDGNNYGYAEVSEKLIDHFDLLFYPFKSVYGLNSKLEFTNSFKYDTSTINEIKQDLEDYKTISHNIILPNKDELACIKNYYKLNAKITTTRKVNTLEQAAILSNVFVELYKNFNARQVEFGEELSYDTILSVMENADPRIKSISLEEPQLETKYCAVSGGEFSTSAGTVSGATVSALQKAGDIYYNKLVLNNVLAGRVPLFNYDTNFKPNYAESAYPSWQESGSKKSYDLLYPAKLKDDTGIKYIKTGFDISGGQHTKDVVLKQNEVIQFRMPNLKTEITYPAYTNYFLHLDVNSISGRTLAIPATMQTLATYLNQDILNRPTDVGAYWNDAINYIATTAGISSTGITSITITGTSEEQKDKAFADAKKTYKALFTFDGSKYTYCPAYIHTQAAEGTEGEEGYVPAVAEVSTYYYIEIISDTFVTWINWVRTQIGLNGQPLEGLYDRKAPDDSRNYGKLVDNAKAKYLEASAWKSSTAPFDNYYVQKTWATDVEPNANSATYEAASAHTKDGLGRDAVLKGISKNQEYRLKQGEYLLINYTSSSNSDSGEEIKTVHNDVIKPNPSEDYYPIIRPNFDLVDSKDYRSTHSYSKTSGYDFTDDSDVSQPVPGMFSLDTNQQIELRKFVEIKLTSETTNLYWERNDEVVEANDRIYFNFDEEPIVIENDGGESEIFYTAYTLKDGEYLYYTNKDKTNIAYYGAGSKIKRTQDTPAIWKSADDSVITTEDIVENGLSAAIPWRPYNLGKTGSEDRCLTIVEYQYRTLAVGSKLIAATDDGTVETPTTIDIDINNNWKNVKAASYEIDGVVTALPKVTISDNVSWQVRSKLELNVGPDNAQQLYSLVDEESKQEVGYDWIELYYKDDSVTGNQAKSTAEVKLYPHNGNTISIKANKDIFSTTTTTNVTTTKYGTEGGVTDIIYDCQIKVFALNSIRDSENNNLNLGNYGNGNYTKLAFNDMDKTKVGIPHATINAVVPSDRFGLLMFQNNKIGSSLESENIAIRFIKDTGTADDPGAPQIFNNNGAWWDGKTSRTALWATEGTYYGKLTRAQFDALKADTNHSSLYVRTKADLSAEGAPSGSDDPKAYYRWDYSSRSTNPCYYYQSVAELSWNESANYCQLLDVGSNGDETTLYHLRPGINIVKIPDGHSCKIQIFGDGTLEDIVIFGNLDLVYSTKSGDNVSSINDKLCYKITTDGYTTVEQQILSDIKAIDNDLKFYYNAKMDNETVIDLNEKDDEDNLENPLTWFNYNNINNKFVVSEIDADYLSTGVTIARNSRL